MRIFGADLVAAMLPVKDGGCLHKSDLSERCREYGEPPVVHNTVLRLRDRAGARTVLRDTYRQAGEFLKVYRAKLDTQQVRLLDAYSGVPLHPKWKRVWVLLRYRLFKKGFKRKLAQILFV